ncbi:major capsid protein [Streptomyces phage PapayaSalad]|uniref:Major capsid protein n=3 Tax=Austintatiousvirus TaxID=2733169 RepID=A0A1J0MC20_9CAUD|nr:major head protein [Streptomyces phage Ididsumtinwong]YP_009788156.1 major head protein [Streptomyces phage PapayaSalad]APD18484.1 major capsid protein [Streptomyces phage Ididsumtinwong]APD18594.1 major capsid protein [Streptomyces phage PapayaSalad]APD18705.1 major capsid protein [Streptomyces phage Bioscum]
MAQTTSAQMIVPEVWGDMAQAQFLGKVRVAGSDAVQDDNTLEGAPGDEINFPKWGALSDLDELTETAPLVPVAMSTSSAKATIKEVGKAVEITDKSRLVGLGDPEAEARRQFGVLAARKVDADLIAQAQADETAQGGGNPFRFTTAAGKTKFTWLDAMVPGIAQFGDEWEPDDFSGLYLNSAQYADALADPQFVDAAKLGNGPSAAVTGSIGRIGGVPVFVTNRVAAGKFLIMKRGVLGLLYKRRPLVEQDRDILARSNVITTTIHYAVKRLDDRGVAVGTLATT